MPSTVWKGYLSFGLVSFPVRLYTAARPEAVHFHMLHRKDHSRIREVIYCAKEDKPIDRDDVVKGYEYEKGEYVVVEEADLKKIAPPTARVMEILQFVKSSEVDPVYLEKSYYVGPEDAVSKPYALLLEAMKDTKFYALAKVTMHGREHIVIIRPTRTGMVLHTMYYEDELHAANAEAAKVKKAEFSKKEMDLATRLIETLAAPFKPGQFEDEYRKNVERMIEQKKSGHKVTAVKAPKVGGVVNILEALQASLSRTKSGHAAKKVARKKTRKAA